MPDTIKPQDQSCTFMRFPLCVELDSLKADVTILGIPYGASYDPVKNINDQANAPLAVRRESLRFSFGLDHYDFDLGGPLFNGRNIKVVDCGDVPGDPSDTAGHYDAAEKTVRKILSHGALPVIIGGDHGVPIPVLRAFDGHGPINLVHIDAHIDWRDEVNGVREGYSSPIRRASEMSHVDRIFQVGMRSQGSAREQEVKDALSYGADIISAYDVHEHGINYVLDRIPGKERYYLTIDADGLDPAVMPAVAAPAQGGLLFHQVRGLIHGLVKKGRLMGMDIVEITPERDVNGISAFTAAQLIHNYIGVAVRSGYFD